MPRLPIDYTKTIIYKLCCKDPDVLEIYVGHTTHLVNRKNQHKNGCHNPNNDKYNLKVYQYIRANGGWENFNMIVLERFSCIDEYDACAKEQEYITNLHSTLNSKYASRTHQQYYEDNKEQKTIYCRQYYEDNIVKKQEQGKQYYENNKEQILIRNSNYREENRVKIA